MKNKRLIFLLPFVLALLFLGGCASSSTVARHAFGFDTVVDRSNTEVLDYRYGSYRMPEWKIQRGLGQRRFGINGPIRVGESLYVRWKDKGSGRVYEDTVDLRDRLPKNMINHKIYFITREDRLFVYLVTPERRPEGWAIAQPALYVDKKSYRIYPDPVLPEPIK